MQLVEPAVGGTLNVLESCAKAGSVKRVVMTSSMAAVAYKQADKDHVFTSEDWSDVELLKKKELWYMLRYGGRGMQLLKPVCSLCFSFVSAARPWLSRPRGTSSTSKTSSTWCLSTLR